MLGPEAVISLDTAGFFRLAVWAVMATLAVLAIRFLILRRGIMTPTSDNIALHAKPILTEAEARFFSSLQRAVDGQYLVWPQLPLWTFIDTRSKDARLAARFQNRINLKRVDFCLVERQTCIVHTAIELDDRSHQRPDRQQRDAFVQDVLKKVGVPLIRIEAAKSYDPQTIRRQLDQVAVSRRKLREAT